MARSEGDKLIAVNMSGPEALAVRIEAAKANVPVARFVRRAINAYFDQLGSDVRILEHRPSGKPNQRQKTALKLTRQQVITASMREKAKQSDPRLTR